MIQHYILALLKAYPIIMYICSFILIIGLVALFSYPIYVTFIKFKFRNKKDEIYEVYIKHTPEIYKARMELEIGGWLLNMSVPYFPIWSFKLIEKFNREQIEEWRDGVRKGFGDDYIFYVWYLYITRTVYLIFIPWIIVIAIDMAITK